MKERSAVSVLIWCLSAIAAAAVLWVFGKYVIISVMPFIIAYVISFAIRSPSAWIAEKTGTGRKFWAVLLVIITIGAIFLFVSWLVSTLISEGRGFVVSIGNSLDDENNIIRRTVSFFSNFRERIPFLSAEGATGSVGDSVYEGISKLLKDSLASLSASFAAWAAAVIGKLPGFIFALVTTVIAVFYISLDSGEISKETAVFIGEKNASRLRGGKGRVMGALSKYIKSYLIIMLMTFAELLLGFVILDINYSVLLAFLISFIDLLPVLGSGTVLVPWGLISLAAGKIKTGAGLIILWAVMYVIRQIAEPHIIGSVMGIHPLTSLFSLYIGYVFFGFGGMIFLPIAVYIAKAIITEKRSQSA